MTLNCCLPDNSLSGINQADWTNFVFPDYFPHRVADKGSKDKGTGDPEGSIPSSSARPGEYFICQIQTCMHMLVENSDIHYMCTTCRDSLFICFI